MDMCVRGARHTRAPVDIIISNGPFGKEEKSLQ